MGVAKNGGDLVMISLGEGFQGLEEAGRAGNIGVQLDDSLYGARCRGESSRVFTVIRPHAPTTYFAISLSFFKARTFTTLRAGFALNTQASPVKGLTPLRALVAGLRMTLILAKPGSVNT